MGKIPWAGWIPAANTAGTWRIVGRASRPSVRVPGFTGESMFHLEPNASKLALLHLVDHLAARGATWIDIQQLTPHFEVLGARVLPRDEFLERLARARQDALRLF